MNLTTPPLEGFAHAYGIELLYPERPVLNQAALVEIVSGRRSDIRLFDGDMQGGLVAFLYAGQPPDEIRGECLIAPGDPADALELDEPALEQSWRWPDARAAVAECQASVLVTDLLGTGLPHRERLALFQEVLDALLELAPCTAIYWRPAGHYVEPAAWQHAMQAGGVGQPLPGAINMRHYRIAGTEDTVIDTLGLAALGLRDLQCRFRHTEPEAIMQLLSGAAITVFEHGLVIADGQKVKGPRYRDQWRYRYAQSLVPPQRPVIMLDPGEG